MGKLPPLSASVGGRECSHEIDNLNPENLVTIKKIADKSKNPEKTRNELITKLIEGKISKSALTNKWNEIKKKERARDEKRRLEAARKTHGFEGESASPTSASDAEVKSDVEAEAGTATDISGAGITAEEIVLALKSNFQWVRCVVKENIVGFDSVDTLDIDIDIDIPDDDVALAESVNTELEEDVLFNGVYDQENQDEQELDNNDQELKAGETYCLFEQFRVRTGGTAVKKRSIDVLVAENLSLEGRQKADSLNLHAVEIKVSKHDLLRDQKLYEYADHADFLWLCVPSDLEKIAEDVMDRDQWGMLLVDKDTNSPNGFSVKVQIMPKNLRIPDLFKMQSMITALKRLDEKINS